MKTTATWVALLLLLGGMFLVRERHSPWVSAVDGFYADWILANCPLRDEEVDHPVVLLEINEQSLEIAPDWPWEAMHFALILKSLSNDPPAVVVFTPMLDWLDEDSRYLESLENYAYRTPNLVLPVRLGVEPIPEYRIQSQGLPFFSNVYGKTGHLADYNTLASAPPSSLLQASRQGGVNLPPLDEIHRKVPLVYRFQGNVTPSLALQAHRLFLKALPSDVVVEPGRGIEIGEGAAIPVDRAGALRLDARILRHLKRIPYHQHLLNARQVVAGDDDKPSISGNIVVVGRTDEQSRTLPLTAQEKVSLAELTALTLASLHLESFVMPAPLWMHGIVLAFYTLLALGIVRWKKRNAYVVLLLVSSAYLLSSISLFQLENTVPPLFLPAACTVFLMLTAMLMRSGNKNRS